MQLIWINDRMFGCYKVWLRVFKVDSLLDSVSRMGHFDQQYLAARRSVPPQFVYGLSKPIQISLAEAKECPVEAL